MGSRNMNQVSAIIFGASGYSGEELVRRLSLHPGVRITAITSRQAAGKRAADVFPWLNPKQSVAQLRFQEPVLSRLPLSESTVAFLALPHGVAHEFAGPLLDAGVRVLDLSADFRLKDARTYAQFYGHEHPQPELLARSVYGLPEIHREKIKRAQLVACPGCFPTSILLPVLPLVKHGLIRPESVIATSLSGVSGAGRKIEQSYLFVECNESARAYGLPLHRHLSEIEQEISAFAGRPVTIQFSPHLIPLNRGIVSTIYGDPIDAPSESDIEAVLQQFYSEDAFIRLLGSQRFPDVKNVAFTNAAEIAWRVDPRTGKIILLSSLDNLLKGAAGQAIQCLNIMEGWDEGSALIA